MNSIDVPYSLKERAECERREELLHEVEHTLPLLSLLRSLRKAKGRRLVPGFDPLDGGAHASVLLLLETPGRRAVESGFVSRNNPDPTAKNLFCLLGKAKLPRSSTLIWNAVPWDLRSNGKSRAPREQDLLEARPALARLLSKLRELEFIVLVGGAAQSLHTWLSSRTEARLLACHHPSARVFNLWPRRREENREVLAWIARRLTMRVQRTPR
jgi:uracil-DNA glycosylase